jgi:hypothetical protein
VAAGWSRTEADYVEPVDAGPDKVHFRVQFTRYREDGSVIGSYRSLYLQELRYRDGSHHVWTEFFQENPPARVAIQVTDANAAPGGNVHLSLDVVAIDPA